MQRYFQSESTPSGEDEVNSFHSTQLQPSPVLFVSAVSVYPDSLYAFLWFLCDTCTAQSLDAVTLSNIPQLPGLC